MRFCASNFLTSVRTVATGENIEKEVEHLSVGLHPNGYSDHVINKDKEETNRKSHPGIPSSGIPSFFDDMVYFLGC